MTIDTLWKNEWLEIKVKDDWYTYSHSPVGDGTGVAILGFRDKDGKREYLGRYENCPAHGDSIDLCSLTGMCDKEGENRKATAIRELEEESGYIIRDHRRIIELGSVRPSKASDAEIFLFAVEIKDEDERIDIVGDGTRGEDGAYADWVSERDLAFSKDSVVSSMMMRLKFNE